MPRRPSASLIVALVALFAALGGTAMSARYLISSPRQVRPGAITEQLLAKSVRVKLARVGNTGNTGPAGATGPKGAKGDKGEPGPAGPSAGYGALGTAADLATGDNVVVSLALPAGAYVVHGNANLLNQGPASVDAECTLGTADGTALDPVAASIPASGEDTLPVDGTVTLAAAGGVRIVCVEGLAPQNLRLASARLNAIRVGALNP